MMHVRRLFWILLSAILLTGTPGWGQTLKPAIPAPAQRSIGVSRDIPYVPHGTEQQKLDLYLPPTAVSGTHPLLVWVHGGGWQAGDKSECPARWLVERGYVVASINYRLTQVATFPAQLDDCKAAIRWLRAHAGEYGIDPKAVAVWGASAGGHLVALLGTTGDTRQFDTGENLDQPSSVQCVVDWFGPTDFLHYGDPVWKQLDVPESMVSRLLGGTVSQNPDKAKAASPVYYVNASSSPFLIMQGDKDNLVPEQQSHLLNEALHKAGVESTLKIIPGAHHGGREFFALQNLMQIWDFLSGHLQTQSAKNAPFYIDRQ